MLCPLCFPWSTCLVYLLKAWGFLSSGNLGWSFSFSSLLARVWSCLLGVFVLFFHCFASFNTRCWDPLTLQLVWDLTELGGSLDMEVTIQIEEEDGSPENPSTMCLIRKVQITKNFNAFGLLEAMRRAMNPLKGFTACEIEKNLFSF
ncbi:hypothetical protein ACS0TY_005876 [Phlomoides rotata]